MPLYDYRCERCGAFRAFAPLAESAAPRPCPGCAAPCAKMLSAPFLGAAGGGGWLTRAQATGPAGGRSWRAACGFGCSHANCR